MARNKADRQGKDTDTYFREAARILRPDDSRSMRQNHERLSPDRGKSQCPSCMKSGFMSHKYNETTHGSVLMGGN